MSEAKVIVYYKEFDSGPVVEVPIVIQRWCERDLDVGETHA
jgi:hypothetical protein